MRCWPAHVYFWLSLKMICVLALHIADKPECQEHLVRLCMSCRSALLKMTAFHHREIPLAHESCADSLTCHRKPRVFAEAKLTEKQVCLGYFSQPLPNVLGAIDLHCGQRRVICYKLRMQHLGCFGLSWLLTVKNILSRQRTSLHV